MRRAPGRERTHGYVAHASHGAPGQGGQLPPPRRGAQGPTAAQAARRDAPPDRTAWEAGKESPFAAAKPTVSPSVTGTATGRCDGAAWPRWPPAPRPQRRPAHREKTVCGTPDLRPSLGRSPKTRTVRGHRREACHVGAGWDQARRGRGENRGNRTQRDLVCTCAKSPAAASAGRRRGGGRGVCGRPLPCAHTFLQL